MPIIADAEYVWVLDPDRRHQILHLRHAGLGHADRADTARRADLRHDASAVHPRTFSGDGKGAHYRGPAGDRDLRVRACARCSDAIMLTTSPLLMNEADRQRFGRVENAVRLSRYGGDCYAYCVLAAGHVDLIIETELKPHDVLALIPIIEGAGGIITTWENGRRIERRPHHRRRRQARARAGDEDC
jgi:myo-inositol-1(or 4)-monophosphatase